MWQDNSNQVGPAGRTIPKQAGCRSLDKAEYYRTVRRTEAVRQQTLNKHLSSRLLQNVQRKARRLTVPAMIDFFKQAIKI